MKKLLVTVAALPLVAAVVVGLFLTRTVSLTGKLGRAPAGQPPVTSLDRESLDELRGAFNESADRARVLVMLSPT